MKSVILTANHVSLILDNPELEELAAEAAVSLNRHVTWMKLILTDSKPNANRQRVPREEFANVIRTGLFMPVKMAPGGISEGHAGTMPIGTMAHLKVNGETIEALAALWDTERETDVQYLKQRFQEGKSIDVSWELTYTQEDSEEGGVAVLRDVCMNAATIVGMPAYEGRTPVIALSQVEGVQSAMETITVEKHEQLLTEATAPLSEKITTLESEAATLRQELEELRAFKQQIEDERERAERLATIRQKFSDANLKVEDEYFASREDTFLTMSEEQLDFFVQELVAAMGQREEASGGEAAEEEAAISLTSKVPNVGRGDDGDVDATEIVDYLRKKIK